MRHVEDETKCPNHFEEVVNVSILFMRVTIFSPPNLNGGPALPMPSVAPGTAMHSANERRWQDKAIVAKARGQRTRYGGMCMRRKGEASALALIVHR